MHDGGERLKEMTRMWFPNDMGLNITFELTLANLDLNALILELVNFDDGDPLQGLFSIPLNATLLKNMPKEYGGNQNGNENGDDKWIHQRSREESPQLGMHNDNAIGGENGVLMILIMKSQLWILYLSLYVFKKKFRP